MPDGTTDFLQALLGFVEQRMGVNVERDRVLGVADDLADKREWYSGQTEKTCEPVAQVVRTEVPRVRLPAGTRKSVSQAVVGESCEDQRVGVRRGHRPLPIDRLVDSLQHGNEAKACCSILGAPNSQASSVGINVTPAKLTQLADPKPGPLKRQERVDVLWADDVEDRSELGKARRIVSLVGPAGARHPQVRPLTRVRMNLSERENAT